MNTPSSVRRPRWLCRVARLGCTVFDRAGPFAAHVETCADCQRFFARADDFESALRRDAARAHPEMPIGLESRILQAVTAPQPRRVEAPSRGPLLAFAAAAVAALVVGAFALRDTFKPAATAVAGNTQPSAESYVALGMLRAISDQWIDDVVSPTKTLVVDNALKQEIGSVYADARSALGFLALNFLPTPRPDASPATSRIGVGG